ncbi:MAG: non-heme iron oxygenase ferredoxin subunit [Gammaproteobacteria bacterium]|nr:non-heme iron oxygenase ferredoxin subunit [Gammaproteobacteria bacterium]
MGIDKRKITLPHPLKPGQITCIDIAGQQILLANVAGTMHATDALCTHEDWPLCNGALKQDTIECPLHGSRFSLSTGIPLDEPATVPLRVYALEELNGELYIILN